MSKLLRPNGDDYPDAATKHLDDAKSLLAAGRIVGAAYLTGYVIECSLKSLAILNKGRPWGHELDMLGKDALRLAALPGSKTARYKPALDSSHSVYSKSTGWQETLRYRGAGHVSASDAGAWLAEAEKVYLSTVAKMLLDGVA